MPCLLASRDTFRNCLGSQLAVWFFTSCFLFPITGEVKGATQRFYSPQSRKNKARSCVNLIKEEFSFQKIEEVLEKRVKERGKSPLPADRVRRSIKKFNLGRWQEYNNVAMWTYEVMWSARKKELSQRSSFSRPIFFDIWELFGSLWADKYLWWPKLGSI